jgi:hypothetical protein
MLSTETGSHRIGAYSPVVLAEILKRTARERGSGSLQVVSGPSVKSIQFGRGSVQFAASNSKKDRLGESMLAHDFISKQDYQLASEKMRSEGCRFGEALVQLGRLTESEIERELAIQIQRIVLSLFRVVDGTYCFEAIAPEASSPLRVGLSVSPLLLKGLRSVDDGKLILKALPPASTVVRVAAAPSYRLDRSRLSPSERAVLELAGDGTEIGDIIRKCSASPTPMTKSAAFRSCFALLCLGLLEPVPDNGAPVEPTASTPAAPAGDSCRELIEEQYERLAAVSETDLLGLRSDAPLVQIEQAYESLKSEWKEVRGQTADPVLLEKIDAIEFRLAAAFAALKVEKERPPATTASPSPSPAPSPEDFARRRRIEQLERDSDLHLQVKDWGGAVTLLQELVSLVPGQPSYHSMLGRAKQHHPSLRKNAEQHFIEAVMLAPDDVRFRLELARYYAAVGNRSRALAEIQAVLTLEPEQPEALRVAASLRTPTPMQKLFRRVFG